MVTINANPRPRFSHVSKLFMLFVPACLLVLGGLGWPIPADESSEFSAVDVSASGDGDPALAGGGASRENSDNYVVTQIDFDRQSIILAVCEDLIFEDVYYETKIQIGSPPQSVSVRLDTSSSDMYLNGDRSSLLPFYDMQSSATSETLNDLAPLRLTMDDKTPRTGRWIRDIVEVLDHSVVCQFAVIEGGYVINTLGMGLENNEFLTNFGEASHEPKLTYPNLCEELKDLGKIQRNGYSLWLDGFTYNSGLLYGVVDHSKYEGHLVKLPIHDLYTHALGPGSKPKKLAVVLDYINAKSETNDYMVEIRKPVVLDSSSAISYLPKKVFDDLGSFFHGEYVDEAGMYILDCASSGEITFEFSGVAFTVDIGDFILPLSSTYLNSPRKCFLPLKTKDYSDHVLGNTFLKELYMVVDLESYEIALAKVVKMNSSQTQSEDIETMVTGIPRAVNAPFYHNTDSLTLTYSTIFGY